MVHIVILGGGFAGVYAARTLISGLSPEHQVTLISQSENFVFYPLLHEVAAGFLEEGEIVQQIPKILRRKNFTFVKAKAQRINFKRNSVITSEGEISYDYLLVALGSEPNTAMMSIPKTEYYTLRSLEDASRISAKLHDLASKYVSSKSRKKAINIVFVGAGATAIELAGEVSSFYQRYFREYGKGAAIDDVNIHMIERADKILLQVNDKFRESVNQSLWKMRIKILTSASISEIADGKIVISKNGVPKSIRPSMIITAAGVIPAQVDADLEVRNERGSLIADAYLRVNSMENVFAAGDNVYYNNPVDGKPIPLLAQSAKSQGIAAAKNIIAMINSKPMKKYEFRSKGFILSVGQGFAVGDIFGWLSEGRKIWWMKRAVYSFEFIGIWNKLLKFWKIAFLQLNRKN